jgi:hypothetical protein
MGYIRLLGERISSISLRRAVRPACTLDYASPTSLMLKQGLEPELSSGVPFDCWKTIICKRILRIQI